MKDKHNKSKQSKYYEHFDRINAPPEVVAKAILNTPPKKKEDWKYLKGFR